MRSSRLGAGLTATVLILGLVACGNDSAGAPAAATTPPPATPASTPSPMATPTVAPIRSTQKYGALTLVLDHKAKPPANAEKALELYEEYERSAAKSQGTNVEDSKLALLSAGTALSIVRDAMQDQKVTKTRSGGTLTVTIKLIRSSPALSAFSTCYDQSKSVLIRRDGTSYTGPGATKYPKMLFTVIVANIGGLRRVTEYTYKADKC